MTPLFKARQEDYAFAVMGRFLNALPVNHPTRVHVEALLLDDNESQDYVTLLDTLFALMAAGRPGELPSQRCT